MRTGGWDARAVLLGTLAGIPPVPLLRDVILPDGPVIAFDF